MTNELETAGAASLGGLSSGGKADLSGQPCRNCGAPVEQRFCPSCGQLAASFHRPFLSLVIDSIGDTLALDSRVWRTLPLLMFRPGVLTRRYNEGKRARYVPPFRLFLLSSLIFYLVAFAFLERVDWINVANASVDGEALSDEEMATLRNEVLRADGTLDEARLEALIREAGGGDEAAAESEPADTTDPAPEEGTPDEPAGAADADTQAVADRLQRIADNPKLFLSAVEVWAPRLSLLLVPFTMLALAIMYFWHRRLYIYDHAIHALHLHSWMYLVSTLVIGLSLVAGAGTASGIFFIAMPIYVLLSLRGAYGTGFFMSFIRMVLLCTFWIVSLSFLMVGVLIASALSI
ncbi:DUF3667 domain-containing protein [Henriciella aquimarina]|uniref:DUF3667 domain-containing protein n=1 Tax=Henriciella aquimarina TaxID=545261 RepID=UPI000A04E274|nr:DUF3667 domain-containing protein [Henriciella aquimarina]